MEHCIAPHKSHVLVCCRRLACTSETLLLRSGSNFVTVCLLSREGGKIGHLLTLSPTQFVVALINKKTLQHKLLD